MFRKYFDLKWGGGTLSKTMIISNISQYRLKGDENDQLEVSVFYKLHNVGGKMLPVIYGIISNDGMDLSFIIEQFPMLVRELQDKI
jgi:hypothetical protein